MTWRTGLCCALLIGTFAGCNSARMVRCDAGGGTVAIPANSNAWPYYHREKAMELIQQKCPKGFEIVSENEIVTGQVANTNVHTDTQENPTLILGGKETNGDKKSNSTAFGGLAIPVGETRSTTHQTTTYRDVTEYRIEYRAK